MVKSLALLAAVVVVAVSPTAPTELLIRAVDEAGHPVRLTRAGVYFDTWGGDEATPLPGMSTSVRVQLDRAGACALTPVLCANHPTFAARLLLEAEGLAPISSDLFDWMIDAPALAAPPVTIRFPRAAPIRLARGEQRDVTLVFRRPRPRSLQLVDPAGAPVTGARVSVWNVYATSNHMGVFEGPVLLKDRTTGQDGRIPIPDGDIEYGFEVHKEHWSLARPSPPAFWTTQASQRVDADVVTLVMRPDARRPLRLTFLDPRKAALRGTIALTR